MTITVALLQVYMSCIAMFDSNTPAFEVFNGVIIAIVDFVENSLSTLDWLILPGKNSLWLRPSM